MPGDSHFAMVCSSNMNRSMEAHAILKKAGFVVSSYGTGQHVKLPGAAQDRPNVYDFGTPYAFILEDLRKKDSELYTRTGLLTIAERNVGVKPAPERWQDQEGLRFDFVLTFEQSVFQRVLEDFGTRGGRTMAPCLVVNLDVKDSPAEAAIMAPQVLALCEMLDKCADDWESCLDDVMDRFQAAAGRRPLYHICFW